jgi:hypothetical protein
MNPAEGTPQGEKVVHVIELGGISSAAGKYAKSKSIHAVERLAITSSGSDHGQSVFNQLQTKGMLLEDLLIGPSAGPVKFDDQWRVIFDAHLVDPVFIAV